jgi:hypothetical protein
MQYLWAHNEYGKPSVCSLSQTYSRVEIWDDGSQGNDEKLYILSTSAPVLRVKGRVSWLRPQNLRPIFG